MFDLDAARALRTQLTHHCPGANWQIIRLERSGAYEVRKSSDLAGVRERYELVH